MTLVRANIHRESLTLKTPFITSLRRVDAVEYIVMELQTACGLSTRGSAPATKAITGETLNSIEQTLKNSIFPVILEKSFDLEMMSTLVSNSIQGNSSAKAAVDMALYTLSAAKNRQPLYKLLRNIPPTPVKTAVTVSLDLPERMEMQAIDLFNDGCSLLKIKVGADDAYDAKRIRSIANALPDATLLVDANQAWSVAKTLQVLDEISDLDIALLEQPVAAEDLAGLKQITERSAVPILADEAVFTVEDARRIIDNGIADMINIKLMKCGGISGALEIIHLCERHNVPCMLGSMLEGPVSIEAALHLAMAFPERFPWIDLDSPLLYRRLPEAFAFTVEQNRFTFRETPSRL